MFGLLESDDVMFAVVIGVILLWAEWFVTHWASLPSRAAMRSNWFGRHT
jgi:hypothetical protein